MPGDEARREAAPQRPLVLPPRGGLGGLTTNHSRHGLGTEDSRLHRLTDPLARSVVGQPRSLSDEQRTGPGDVGDPGGVDDGVALPPAELVRPPEQPGVVPLEKPAKHCTEVPRNLSPVLVLGVDADSDVHPGRRLGEQPAIERRQLAVEDHVQTPGLEAGPLPPTHQGVDVAPLAAIPGEEGVRPVGEQRPPRADLAPVQPAHPDHPPVLLERLDHPEALAEARPQRASTLHQEVVELLAEQDDRRRVRRNPQLFPGGSDETDRQDWVRTRPELRADAQGLGQLQRRGGQSRPTGLVPWEAVPIHQQGTPDSQLAQLNRRRRAGRARTHDEDFRLHGCPPGSGEWSASQSSLQPPAAFHRYRTDGFVSGRVSNLGRH